MATTFQFPDDLRFNRGLIADPKEFARDAHAAAWLFLCGPEFASMDGGLSFADIQASVPIAENVVADPPVAFDLELVEQLLDVLGQLPRPTAVTCRTGPRSSALAYLYAGLEAGVSADDVLTAAREDAAPFTQSDELCGFVRQAMDALAG